MLCAEAASLKKYGLAGESEASGQLHNRRGREGVILIGGFRLQ